MISALTPLARLLLRTESIASSKVEGIQLGPHDLARAEARMESGGKASTTALEILANINAMELAGVVAPLSMSLRNQSWEAVGLEELATMKAGSLSSTSKNVSMMRTESVKRF